MHHGWQIALARPRTVLAYFALAITLLAAGLARLELSTDGRALLPEGADAVRLSRDVQHEFGVEDQLVLVVRAQSGTVLEPRALRVIDDISRAVAALPEVGVERVVSLATEPGDHVRPGSLVLRAWLDPLPRNEADVAALRRGLEKASIYRGTLLSTDTPPSASAVVVGVPRSCERETLLAEVRAIAARHATRDVDVLLVGAPVAESELGTHLLDDLRVLVPLSLAVMALVLALAFGAAAAVWAPLAGVGAAQIAVFGSMGWCGQPVELTTLLVPVLLTAVGVADAIHIFDRYRTELVLRPEASRAAALAVTLGELTAPVLATSLTTAAGFVCFVFSPIGAVRAFGAWLAGGVVVLLVWTIVCLPAVLVLCSEGPFRRSVSATVALSGWRARWLAHCALACERATLAVARRWKPVAALFVVASVLGVLLALRTRVEDSWISGFDRASPLVATTREVDQLFGGTHVLRLRVVSTTAARRGVVQRADLDATGVLLRDAGALEPRSVEQFGLHLIARATTSASAALEFVVEHARADPAGLRLELRHVRLARVAPVDLVPEGVAELEWELAPRGRLKQREVLGVLRALEAFLASRTEAGVGAVLGPWSHLESLTTMLGGPSDGASALLSTQAGIDRALDLYARARTPRRLAQLYAGEYADALVTVLVRHASFRSVGELLAELRAWEAKELAPRGLRLDFAGDLAESQALIEGVVGTEVSSLASSLLLIGALVALGLRSLRLGLCAMLPCTWAVLCVFAWLGASGVPLGVATSMFAAVSLGIGVDFAIHFLARVRSAEREHATSAEALARAARESGPAIAIDALAVGLGFAVLCVSRVPTSARLGWLLVISIAGCLAATLLVLPVVLASRAARERSPS